LRQSSRRLSEIEREHFGWDHAQLQLGYMLRSRGYPCFLVMIFVFAAGVIALGTITIAGGCFLYKNPWWVAVSPLAGGSTGSTKLW
jgi:hypothetical protein